MDPENKLFCFFKRWHWGTNPKTTVAVPWITALAMNARWAHVCMCDHHMKLIRCCL